MNGDERWIWGGIAIGLGLVVGAMAGWLIRRWLSNERRRPALQAVASPASLFVFWLSLATGVLFAIAAINPETLRPIPRNLIDWLPNVLAAGLILLAGFAAGLAASVEPWSGPPVSGTGWPNECSDGASSSGRASWHSASWAFVRRSCSSSPQGW